MWRKIYEESPKRPTYSAFWNIGILVLDKDTGFKNDSMGEMFVSLLLVKATNFVLSGTNIVLDLFAYLSLRDASRLRENKNRAVSSVWPIAGITIMGIDFGLGWLG